MDWIARMNAAMEYTENNMALDIDDKEIAKIVGCPYLHFQRMFAFIAEISLSEYIRRRRLTLAAFELQHNSQSVIEIAQKYGYESHSSFTRAFHEFHGIAPIAARKSGAKLRAYPKISFQISIAGGTAVTYRVEKIPAFSVTGVMHRIKTEKSFDAIPKIWQELKQNGAADRLVELMGPDLRKLPGGILGVLADGHWGRNDEFSYYAAVSCDREIPSDMEKLDFPDNDWVVFEAPTLADLPRAWKRLYLDWLPTSNYSLADLPAIECYYPPGSTPQNELWVPIVKKPIEFTACLNERNDFYGHFKAN